MNVSHVYHERQSAALCGRHALNNLLQGPFFDDVSLSEIAISLDQREVALLTGATRQHLINGGSNNVDDSGNFSVDTLREALKTRGIEMSCETSAVERALTEPDSCMAFMLNQQAHWISLRRFGSQWVNLNSLLESPELISNFFLSAFLAQLRSDGYSVFVISGNFPPPTPPQFHERERWHKPESLKSGNNPRSVSAAAERRDAALRARREADSDPDFELALRASLSEGSNGLSSPPRVAASADDDDLQRAIAASLADQGIINASSVAKRPDALVAAASVSPPLASCRARSRVLTALLGSEKMCALGGASELPFARLSLRCSLQSALWPGMPTAPTFVSERQFSVDSPISLVFAWAELEWLKRVLPDSSAAAESPEVPQGEVSSSSPFSLTVSFPRKTLRADDERTVGDFGLAPSAVLTLNKL
jgi:ataxin-3